jgi:hemerythrin-like domain-containing protein
MCEYCGCQEIDAIALLTAEHEDLRSVARQALVAERAGDHDAAVAAVRVLIERLAPHTRIEEEGLFPAMSAEFGDHMATLVGEHRTLEDALAALAASTAPDPTWAARMDLAVADLFDHILKEQDGVFPAALASLSSQDWDHLDAVRRNVTSGVEAPA